MGITVSTGYGLNEYQRESAFTRNNDLEWREATLNALLGLAGEAGETCDMLKKHLFHDHALDVDKLEFELGDVLFYPTWLAALHDLTLEDIAKANVAKLRARYPDGFDPERSRNREK